MTFEYIRTESGEFKCPHCEFTKKNQSTVHMHIKAKHNGTFKHKCEHCTYECAARQTLENHVISKHPEQVDVVREFACPCNGCEFESLTKGGLRSHYLLKHLAKYVSTYFAKSDEGIQCSHCGTGFNSKPSFIYHLVNCLPAEVKADPVAKKGLCI